MGVNLRLGRIIGRIGHIYPIRRRIGHIYSAKEVVVKVGGESKVKD